MKTQILYEDAEILVCHKPAGLATQSANPASPDAENELKKYIGGGELHVVHRLDQPVEGILVFARGKRAAADLSAQVNDGRMRKIYHALVCGRVEPECAELTDYLIYLPVGTRFDAKSYLGKFTQGTDTTVLNGSLPGDFSLRTTGSVDTGTPGVYSVAYEVTYNKADGVSSAYTGYSKLIVVVEG